MLALSLHNNGWQQVSKLPNLSLYRIQRDLHINVKLYKMRLYEHATRLFTGKSVFWLFFFNCLPLPYQITLPKLGECKERHSILQKREKINLCTSPFILNLKHAMQLK